MPRAKNPFTPTFGMVPPILAGRDRIIEDMTRAFDDGPGNPNLSTLLVGARGSGKTALLSCFAENAQTQGWVAANVVAAPGMLENVIQQLGRASAHLVEGESKRKLSAVGIGQLLNLEWVFEHEGRANWRTRMDGLLDKLEEIGIGALITVDEVRVDVDEMIELVSTYQLFVREGRKVSLLMAGLPDRVTDLVDDDRITFLRRARLHRLGRIGDADVASAVRRTVEGAGKTISDAALSLAVEAIGGFAYLVQLVGYFMWAEGENAPVLDERCAQRGVERARDDFERSVLEATYRGMSEGDLSFARAMLADEHESRLSDIAARMGRGTNYASTYKTRLLKQGVIEELPGRTFAFAIPLFREYLARGQRWSSEEEAR